MIFSLSNPKGVWPPSHLPSLASSCILSRTLSAIVSNKTKKANKYLSDINAKYEDIRYKGPVNLSLHYYKDPGKILDSFIAMEYTICGNISEVDDNIKSFLYRTIIPEIIAEYNKTKIADTVKIKEGSMIKA